jgi:hypothetical protein
MSIDPSPSSSGNYSDDRPLEQRSQDRQERQKKESDSLCNERYQMLVDIQKLLTEKQTKNQNDPKIMMLNAQKEYLLSIRKDPVAHNQYLTAKAMYAAGLREKPFTEKVKEKFGSQRVSELNDRIEKHMTKVTKSHQDVEKSLNEFIKGQLKTEVAKLEGKTGEAPGPLHPKS